MWKRVSFVKQNINRWANFRTCRLCRTKCKGQITSGFVDKITSGFLYSKLNLRVSLHRIYY